MLRLVPASTPEHWAAARRLVEEYAASLGVDLGFQDFRRELDALPREYGPPAGHFLLAADDAQTGLFVGCGAIRRFSPRTCEMKRLYLTSAARGTDAGRELAQSLIDEARRLGYERIVLDTLPSMTEAPRLYASLGFTPIPQARANSWRQTGNSFPTCS